MQRWEKAELTRLVKAEIARSTPMADVIRKLSKLGFNQHTIRHYYKTFSEVK